MKSGKKVKIIILRKSAQVLNFLESVTCVNIITH